MNKPLPYIAPPEAVAEDLAAVAARLRETAALNPQELAERILAFKIGLSASSRGVPNLPRHERQRIKTTFAGIKRKSTTLYIEFLGSYADMLDVYAGTSSLTGESLASKQSLIGTVQARMPDDYAAALASDSPELNTERTQAHYLTMQHTAGAIARTLYRNAFGTAMEVVAGDNDKGDTFTMDSQNYPAAIGINNAYSIACTQLDVSIAKVLNYPVLSLWAEAANMGHHAPGVKVVKLPQGPGPGHKTH